MQHHRLAVEVLGGAYNPDLNPNYNPNPTPNQVLGGAYKGRAASPPTSWCVT